jgi:hypothetical protein
MSGPNVAWTTAAATAIICAVLASCAAWLLLTEPLVITAGIEPQQAGSITFALVKAAGVLIRAVWALIW